MIRKTAMGCSMRRSIQRCPKTAISNAKALALDAGESCDAAMKAYNDDLDKALADRQENEDLHLKEKGSSVFLSDISGNKR